MEGATRTVKIYPDEMIIRENAYDELLKGYSIYMALMEQGVEDWPGYTKAMASIGAL